MTKTSKSTEYNRLKILNFLKSGFIPARNSMPKKYYNNGEHNDIQWIFFNAEILPVLSI